MRVQLTCTGFFCPQLKQRRADHVLREVMTSALPEGLASPSIPWYFAAVPTAAVQIKQGSVVICARDLPFQTAITVRSGHGLVCVSKPNYPMVHAPPSQMRAQAKLTQLLQDVYKMTLKMTLSLCEMVLLSNTKPPSTKLPSLGRVWRFGPRLSTPDAPVPTSIKDHRTTAGWTETSKVQPLPGRH